MMSRGKGSAGKKTVVGILASRDDAKCNISIVEILRHIYTHRDKYKKLHICDYQLLFTGGTYRRVFYGDEVLNVEPLTQEEGDWFKENCGVTVLPSVEEGGMIYLSFFITQQICNIVWPFYSALENHWIKPENLAFVRLSDQWHVKRLMNRGSVMVWLNNECETDYHRNLQKTELKIVLRRDDTVPCEIPIGPRPEYERISISDLLRLKWAEEPKNISKMTIALIAHNEMKGRMVEFAIDHQAELAQFDRILATGTTGREVAANTSKKIETKIIRYHSGPKGGDIEIATEILNGKCDVVVFFIDPLNPHPHIEDIRVVFQACMIQDQVIMITNEMHAREFMSRVVRGKDTITLYPSSK